jgi:hypothetical protein
MQPKPPHNLEKPPASWQEAHDMLGYIINSALATGQDLSLHGCQVRQQRPRGAPQTDITGGQLGLQGPVWKPPYGSAVILRAAKTSEAGQAIAGHISVMLASQVVIEAVHSIMQMWDRDEAESMRAERPIVHSAITRLTQLIQHHQHGGLVRAQVLSNGRSLCELPGKGEASAHGVHLAARVKQILTQVVEDLVGLAASATLRARIASFVEDIFQGTIKRSDVIELCGAMSPDDEDNLHGASAYASIGEWGLAAHMRQTGSREYPSSYRHMYKPNSGRSMQRSHCRRARSGGGACVRSPCVTVSCAHTQGHRAQARR